ncbi:ABC transporter ATP-binding protein/permease [Bordetella genomosp. 4]|uniref:ABC transporter n=1 Tax=Bordetella genomosp. 4 TaxID=463044 RepID=A0A261TZL3_9BORD|nr:ABC transporter ATP-binding protein [Bordetella genomosp. 4]OZI54430.1 ABC transporter [Bordetella genomosp. 4]
MYFDSTLWAMTRGVRLRMLMCAVLGLLGLTAGIARFALLGKFLAELFAGASGTALWWPLAGAALAIVLRGGFEHALNLLANRNAALIQNNLRAQLYDKIVELGPAWFGGQRTGGVMLAVIDGVEQLQSFFGRYLPQLFIAACAPIMIFAFIAWWDWPVALVLLVAALITLVLPLAAHRSHKDASRQRARAFKAFGEEFLDAMQGLPTLKAFGQSRAWGERLAQRARALSDNTFRVLGREVSARFATDIGITVGAAAALALGAWRVADGQMTLAALLVVLMAGTEIFRPLRDMRSVLHQGLMGQSAAASVRALLDATTSAPQGSAAAAQKATTSSAAGANQPWSVETRADYSAPAPLPRQDGLSVAFRHVAFSYPGGRQITHQGMDFEIRPGERVGIVGPSGSGKSTLVRLLLRLHDPQSGVIEIDGRDLRTLNPEAVRASISLVAQDSMLFHGTVEENLLMARPDATPDQILAATTAANAHAFISALPQGYQTVLGERGTQLSGGQRQRLTIARALLRDTPILILDEALSSVDAENEAEIQQALDRLSRGRTTLVLAHRLSSVIGADRILVLDGGRIAETGTHETLMAGDTLYRQLMGGQQDSLHVPPETSNGDVANVVQAQLASAPETAGARSTADDSIPAGDTAFTSTDDDPKRPTPTSLDTEARHITTRQVLQTLTEIIRPWKKQFAITVGSGIGRVAAFIGVSVLGALIIARLKNGEPFDGLLIGLFAAAIAAAALHWIESWLAHSIAYQLLAEMRISLYQKLEALAPAYLLRRRSGDLVGLATQDVETVEYFYAHTVAPAFVAILVPVIVLAILGIAAWPLMLALLPFLLWAGLSPWLNRARVDAQGSRARQALGLLSAHLAETIQGLSDLVAFSATGRRRDAFLTICQDYQRVRLTLLADLSRQSALLEIATGLGGLAVATAGAWWVMQGALAAGMLPLLILLSVAAFLPVSEIAQVSRQLADTLASTRRLRTIHDEPVPVVDGPLAPPLTGAGLPLAFEDVTFTYPGRLQPALRHVSLSLPAGATLALVGPSGAGKSTLASLLLRFWDPQEGAVRIGEERLPELTLDALYGRIALVAQDTWLLNGTLEDNIRLARPHASQDELDQAVARAALADFVAGLPEGLQTPVGERGVALSGGQRQRIAIARAFLRDAPILILDEATSHLDAISESQVHQALAELMRHRTTLIIAHRLSTIRQADTIAVVDGGQIVESGKHDALLQQGGAYANLVNRQMQAARQ